MIRARNIIIVLMFFIVPLRGQMSNTLYFMDRIPQFNQMNPAFQTKCNVYVGVPGLSTFMFNIGNNSLNWSDIYQYDKQSKTALIFLANSKTQGAFIKSLETENRIFTNLQSDILAFGFRVSSWYFSFSTSLKTDVSAYYPKTLAEIFINGFKVGDSFDLKEFGFNTMAYGEMALGASKIINDEFTVGGKVKFLAGLLNMSTNNKNFQFETNRVDGVIVNTINSDLTFNVYSPIFAETPDTGDISLTDIFETKDSPDVNAFQNTGFATDLGVTYSGFDKLKLSASILDLGYISWSKNVYNYKMKGNFEFKGVDTEADSFGNAFDDVSNAISDSFKFTKSREAYKTYLPTKFYIGAEYEIESFFSVGLLSMTQYYRSQFTQQIMAAANFRPLNMLMLSTSYSFFNNGFSNMGIGLTLRLAPFQIYFISDNIPLRLSKDMMPYKLEYINFRFGLNWVFGCSDKKKMKDKPMSWE